MLEVRPSGVQPPACPVQPDVVSLQVLPACHQCAAEAVLVRPLGENMHIKKIPLSRGTLEGGVKVLLLMLVTQRQPDLEEDGLLMLG
jgi:hypothetical protein